MSELMRFFPLLLCSHLIFSRNRDKCHFIEIFTRLFITQMKWNRIGWGFFFFWFCFGLLHPIPFGKKWWERKKRKLEREKNENDTQSHWLFVIKSVWLFVDSCVSFYFSCVLFFFVLFYPMPCNFTHIFNYFFLLFHSPNRVRIRVFVKACK